ncbi:MAG: hypothetical protein IH827_09550 [Myxococcales bacterium]|nr:hypothetical protein [Myxococcales bacterium]
MSRAQKQYLDRYAEPEAGDLGALRRRFGHVLTVPAYGEGRELRKALASIPAGPLGDVLIVLVVNGRVDSPRSMKDANLAMLEELRAAGGRGVPIAQNAVVHEHPRGALLLVDRATPGRELPPRHGVGLARKIAADIALALWSEGRVASPWIHCTDADVVLPQLYFEATTPGTSIARNGSSAAEDSGAASGPAAANRLDRASDSNAALLYPFRHVDATSEALEYEISLRYYVGGLRFAGSPYAFHTIGSTVAVHATAYARVRGFPRRLAAEDFYLLNKLAKVGTIRSLHGEPIRLSARTSNRTPFGTGHALEHARGRERDAAPLCVYHPDVFSDLGAWLQTLHALAIAGEAADPADLLAKSIGGWPSADAERLRAPLEECGAWAAARIGVKRCRTPATRAKHLHGGFDAFRTLKLIHGLRAGGLASIPLRDALSEAAFMTAREGAPLEDVREQLAAAEQGREAPAATDQKLRY